MTALYFVARPVRGKLTIYVPTDSAEDEDTLREVTGPRAKIARGEDFRDGQFRTYQLSRHYTSQVVTYLRSLPGSPGVRFRTERDASDHCTPQCEGAWRDAERGEAHDDFCQCPFGGTRHNSGSPWWQRFDLVREQIRSGYRYEIRHLPPIQGVSK